MSLSLGFIGNGRPDYSKILLYLKNAAKAGHADAKFILALKQSEILGEHEEFGLGIDIKTLQSLAIQGHIPSINYLKQNK
jgi:TPR repeat protein